MTASELKQLHHPFLEGMSDSHLEALASCAMPTRFGKDEILFKQDEMANRFYLLQKGSVLLQVRSEENEAKLDISRIGGGDVLGWSWLFPPYIWHFDAVALKDTTAVFFYGTRLREKCEQDPALGYELMKRFTQVLLDRLQSTRRKLIQLQHHSS